MGSWQPSPRIRQKVVSGNNDCRGQTGMLHQTDGNAVVVAAAFLFLLLSFNVFKENTSWPYKRLKAASAAEHA